MIKITFNLHRPEFSGEGKPRVWAHTAPGFRFRLERLKWNVGWAIIWNGLLDRYAADPDRPHCVYEAFMRGNRGYVALIVAATSPLGESQVRGLLYECRLNLAASSEARLTALYNLGQNALTQILAEATGDPNYFLVWEQPQP